VISKSESGPGAVRWVSDGTGEYEVSNLSEVDFARGTKIVLKLRTECRDFANEGQVEKVIRRYSLFN
jgi:HSP90 family molecular chaperone